MVHEGKHDGVGESGGDVKKVSGGDYVDQSKRDEGRKSRVKPTRKNGGRKRNDESK